VPFRSGVVIVVVVVVVCGEEDEHGACASPSSTVDRGREVSDGGSWIRGVEAGNALGGGGGRGCWMRDAMAEYFDRGKGVSGGEGDGTSCMREARGGRQGFRFGRSETESGGVGGGDVGPVGCRKGGKY